MFKRGIPLLFVVVALLSLLLGSVSVSAALIGCSSDADCSSVWEVTSDGSGCKYNFDCVKSWWGLKGDCKNPSTEACSHTVGTTFSSGGNGYTTICTSSGCQDSLAYDCNSKSGCSNNLYDSYYFTGYSLSTYKCEKTTSCLDSCCPTGQKCDGGVCKTPEPCTTDKSVYDTDNDGYKDSGCPGGTDCNDNNANVYPGSCHADAVTWSSSCSTTGTGGCNTGTCTRALPSGCEDVCGDGKVTGSEKCEPSVSTGTKFCSSDYGSLSYGCKSDCTWEDPACPSCGDGICNGPETKTSCSDDCGKCGNGKVDTGKTCDPNDATTKTKKLTCTGGYPDVTQTCKADCSGYDGICGSCADGELQSPPEVCKPGQTQTCPNGQTQFCSSSTCTWLVCPTTTTETQPTCTDSVKNGDETGVDCGVSCVSGSEVCGDGVDNNKDCQIDEGCTVVAQETCSDGVKNQGETGIDCGGPCPACQVCTPNQVITHTCGGCGYAYETVCNAQGTGTGTRTVNDADCTSGCQSQSPDACAGVELDSSQSCCTAAGYQWVRSGEHDAGVGTPGGGGTCTGSEWGVSTTSSVPYTALGSDSKAAKLAVYGDKAYYAVLKSSYDETSGTATIVGVNVGSSSAVKASYGITCPSGTKCAPGANGFKAKAYNGKLYLAWAGKESLKWGWSGGTYKQVQQYNIFSATVGISPYLKESGTITASAALTSDQAQYLSMASSFDFAVDDKGAEYVYVKEGPVTSVNDEGFAEAYDRSQGGLFSSKRGKISAWPKTAIGGDGSYWAIPVIAKAGDSTYYVWGETTTEYAYVPGAGWQYPNIYGVKVGAASGSSTAVNVNAIQKTKYGEYGQLVKSGLDAVAVGKKVYFSHSAQTNTNIWHKMLSFDTATGSVEDQFLKSFSRTGYASPMRLAAAGSVVAAMWTEGFDGIGLTYGSAKDEFAKNEKGITHFGSDYQGLYATHAIDIAASSDYVSYIDSAETINPKSTVNGATGYTKITCKTTTSTSSGSGTGSAGGTGSQASSSNVDVQFTDSKGERRATSKLLPNEERCFGDDSNEQFFVRTRDCKAGICTSDQFDKRLCDKASDCIYAGKCYSDLKLVAATFFNNNLAAAWSSNWKSEVSADVGTDGKVEFCDPGQWQDPVGSVAGTVTDSTTGLGIPTATVAAVGTSSPQLTYSNTTAADGHYVIGGVEPANYDVTASKTGYNSQSQNNQPVLPFQTTTVDFQLAPSGGRVSGFVRNVSGSPVAQAVVKVLGTSLSAVTAVDGSYSVNNVPPGSYDVTAGKASDGYEDAASFGKVIVSGSATAADFTLVRALGDCEDDCTKVSSNLCDASCDGKGLCWFYNDATKAACDGTFGIVEIAGPPAQYVDCCKGKPYTPIKAQVTVPSKNVVVTKKPVVYKGKFVNMVIVVFENPKK